MNSNPTPWLLAACYRAASLALVVFSGNEVALVERHRFDSRPRTTASLGRIIAAIANDYDVAAVVVEPRGALADAAKSSRRRTVTLSLADAKQALLGSSRATTKALCRQVVAAHPKLRRFVKILRTGDVAMSDRRRTATLLAVALGLAAARADRSHSI